MIEVKDHPEMEEYLMVERAKRNMSKFEESEIKTRISAMEKEELVFAIKYFPTGVIQNELTRRMQKAKRLNAKIKELYKEVQEV